MCLIFKSPPNLTTVITPGVKTIKKDAIINKMDMSISMYMRLKKALQTGMSSLSQNLSSRRWKRCSLRR
jgi:hypothetical protein